MEKVIKLYTYKLDTNGNPTTTEIPFPDANSQAIISDFEFDASRMGATPSLKLTVHHATCLDNVWNDFVHATFNGEIYFLSATPTSSYSNKDSRYVHEVTLVSERDQLNNVYFFDVINDDAESDSPVSNSSIVVFSGDIYEVATRLNRSLAYTNMPYTVVVDEDISSEYKLVSFSNMYVSQALQEFYKIFNIPYYYVGREIHFGYAPNVLQETFKYGINDSLLSIKKSNANYAWFNRCSGLGGKENLPYYYPNFTPYGNLTCLYNGVETENVQIVDWANFEKYGPSTHIEYKSKNIAESSSAIVQSLSEFVLKGADVWYYKDASGIGRFIAQVWVEYTYKITVNSVAGITVDIATTTNDFADKLFLDKFYGRSLVSFVFDDSKNVISANSDGRYELPYNDAEYEIRVRAVFHTKNGVIPGYEVSKTDLESLDLICKEHCAVNVSKISPAYDIEGWFVGDNNVKLSKTGVQSAITPALGDIISFKVEGNKTPSVANLMPTIYRETFGVERFYNAQNNTYVNPETGEYYEFENEYEEGRAREHIITDDTIFPTIKGITNADDERIDMFVEFAYDEDDNNEVDAENKPLHPYFYAKLRKTNGDNGFNLFAHALEGDTMRLSVTSGNCAACEWSIMVDEETMQNPVQVYEEDTIDANGVLRKKGELKRDENGNVIYKNAPIQSIQNDTRTNEVWIALRKDDNTFGTTMPDSRRNYIPSAGDTFVILGIALPEAYVIAAEKRLEEAIIRFMAENNSEKFNFDITFSRIFFANNPDILAQLNENSSIEILYNNIKYRLYVSSFKYKMSSKDALPDISVKITDTITVSSSLTKRILSQVQYDIAQSLRSLDIKHLGSPHFVSKDGNDIVGGQKRFTDKTTFAGGIFSDNFSDGSVLGYGWGMYEDVNGNTTLVVDNAIVRQRMTISELKVNQATFQRGEVFLSMAGCKITHVADDDENDRYICSYDNAQGSRFSGFAVGDLARCQRYDRNYGSDDNDGNPKFYWRKVVEVGDSYVALSKTDCAANSDVPSINDEIVHVGNSNPDSGRTSVIALSPLNGGQIKVYSNITTYSLENTDYIGMIGYDENTGRAKIYAYGDFYFGDRGEGQYIKYEKGDDGEYHLKINADVTLGGGSTGLNNLSEFQKVQQEAESAKKTASGKTSYYSSKDEDYRLSLSKKWKEEGTESYHVGDTFEDIANGWLWKWEVENGVYNWKQIEGTAVERALSDATAAKLALADIADDNIITPSEKALIRAEYNQLLSDHADIEADIKRYDLSLNNIYGYDYLNAWGFYSEALQAILASTEDNVDISEYQLQELQSNYYEKRALVLDLISATSKGLIDAKTESHTDDYDGGKDVLAEEWAESGTEAEHEGDIFTNTETGATWYWTSFWDGNQYSYQWIAAADVKAQAAIADLDYLKSAFPTGVVLNVNGVTLSTFIGVTDSFTRTEDEPNVVAGLYGGASDTLNKEGFHDATHGTLMIWAGADNAQDPSTATTRIYEDGTIYTNKLIATNADISGKIVSSEGEIGGFEIGASWLMSYSKDKEGVKDGEKSMTLSSGLINFESSTRNVYAMLGLNSFAPSLGLNMVSPLRLENKYTNTSGINVGAYIDVQNSAVGNDAVYINGGDIRINEGVIKGFRTNIRVDNDGGTLSDLDSVIICSNTTSGTTFDLPSYPKHGQMYTIIHTVSTRINIKGSTTHPVRRVSTSNDGVEVQQLSSNKETVLIWYDADATEYYESATRTGIWFLTYIKL